MASKYGFGFKPDEKTGESKDKTTGGTRRRRRRTSGWSGSYWYGSAGGDPGSNTGGGSNDSWQEYARRSREEAWRRANAGSSSAFGGNSIPQQDKEMASELINAGLKALSRKYHPDMGGSHEDMVKVNRAVEALRKVVK